MPPFSPSPRGLRMPAEWEPHEATWLAWPHERTDWPGKFAPIPWVFAEITWWLARSEKVCILVDDSRMETRARRVLARRGVDLGNVQFFHVATDRSWLRDSGPTFVVRDDGARREVAALDWSFNAWARYGNWQRDSRVAAAVAHCAGVPITQPIAAETGRRMVLEGGSIDVNGQGLLLTTEECLLSTVQQRNPGLSREGIEQVFAQYLGVEETIWLKRGIAGDDTHGHVDDLARFVAPDKVVIVTEPDPDDINHEPLAENLALLRAHRLRSGRPLEVVELPMPRAITCDGVRLPASYANFYIANSVVLVPTFNDPRDREALNTLAALFPDRTVTGIHCTDLVWGLGTIHCSTQQQPAA
ncbi:MAG: agmatine deiminase family protein [Candidatus Sumerlaeaceae bacterium]|nr:agmatine deiminase family protein [Candidatus Sumerlaeaceae bacterium]